MIDLCLFDLIFYIYEASWLERLCSLWVCFVLKHEGKCVCVCLLTSARVGGNEECGTHATRVFQLCVS